MSQVVFARDRRKQKAKWRLTLFLIAWLLIAIGVILAIKASKMPIEKDLNRLVTVAAEQENANYLAIFDEPQRDKAIDDLVQNTIDGLQQLELTLAPNGGTLDATSYEDEDQDLNLASETEFSRVLVKGDRLGEILAISGFDDSTALNALLALDPQLKSLSAGQQLTWRLDETASLHELEWLVSEKEARIYRWANNQFQRELVKKQSEWREDVVYGTIKGSFQASLKALDLSKQQIQRLVNSLPLAEQKIAGAKFSLLLKREYIEGKVTNLGDVLALHLRQNGQHYYAIKAKNGRYYSPEGMSIASQKGFSRLPVQGARISSQFNPKRLHPVTKRIAPHRGVDFAVAPGTTIIAPSDGRVARVAYQAEGAGHYIVLSHSNGYQTVYMHLSKTLVSAGSSVKRGQRIALSGNTGRSTGPHLHYEIRINGQAVNPLTVKLPGSSASSNMSDSERIAFSTDVEKVKRRLKF